MRLAFVLESNTDRRILEGLAARARLTVIARERKVTDMPVRDAPFRLVVGPSSRVRYPAFVAARLARERFDGVLAQGYFAGALGAGLAGRSGARPPTLFVCNPMEAYYRCRRGWEGDGRPYRPAEMTALQGVARINARLAGRYAVLSEHLASVVRSHGTAAPVDVVPAYGVDPAVFRPGEEASAKLRRRLGLPASGALFLSSSRVAPEKDTACLLRALRRLRDRGRDAWLVSCGLDHTAVEGLAERLGVGDRVVARGMVDPGDELADHYRAADVMVQASREEGLGFAPLEALACGTPVVAAAVGGLLETIRPGVTGWSYPVGDDAALGAALAEILDDPAEADRRTQAGMAMVRERFAPEPAFDRLVALAVSPP